MVQPVPSENGKGQYSYLIGHQNLLVGIDKRKHVRGQQSCRCILVLCLLINSARTEASDWDPPPAGAQTTLWLVRPCSQHRSHRIALSQHILSRSIPHASASNDSQSNSQFRSGRLTAKRGRNIFEEHVHARML